MRTSRRARLILALLVLTALTLLALDFRGHHPGTRLKSYVSDVFGPIERAITDVVHPIGSAFASLGHLGSSTSQIDALRRENSQLSARLRADATDEHRLAQLESLLGLAAAGDYRIVGARVISYGSSMGYEWTVGIDVGSGDGVRLGQTVINGDGLVGRVVGIGVNTATVELAVDSSFVAGAQLAPTGENCYTTGGGQGPMTLTVLDPAAHLTVGEGVVTFPDQASGLLAPDVPIGQITSVHRAPGSTTPTAQVRPYVNFSALDYVGVIIQQVRKVPRFSLLPKPAPRLAAPRPSASPSRSVSPSPVASP